METSRLEIFFLAFGVFVLVALMFFILWLGVRQDDSEERHFAHGEGKKCLWKEVWADSGDHEPLLNQTQDDGSHSFIDKVRKRSHTIAGNLQH